MKTLSLRTRRPVASPLLALALLGMSACVPEIDDDLSSIREPRLLAIQSTPAEAKESGATTLRALVAAPDDIAAPPVDFRLCLARKPLTQLGPVNSECLAPAPDSVAVKELGRGNEVAVTLPPDACRLFGPLQPAPKAGEASGRPVDPDVTGGFYQPFVATLAGKTNVGAVRIDCDPAGVAREQSIKYRSLYHANLNPLLDEVKNPELGVLDEATTTSVAAGSSISLRASWDPCPEGTPTCSGAEPYVWYNADRQRVEMRREGISVAWYSSRGSFAEEQTGLAESEATSASSTSNTWRVGTQPGKATLWLVIRDTRGGQSWKTFHLEVTP